MNRVILNQGTKTDLSKLFDDLQNFSAVNIQNFLQLMTDSYGVNVDHTPGGAVTGTDLKVTGLGGATSGSSTIYVNPGEALTSGLMYLNVPAQISAAVTSLTVGVHQMYLKFKYSYSDPVDVLSGFAYGLAGGSQLNSRARDSYEIVWDTNPGISGIWLANVTMATGSPTWNYTIEDCRASNILKVRYESLMHQQNTDTYTTATEFYVGGPKGSGLPVALARPITAPINFRITDINIPSTSPAINIIERPKLAGVVQAGLVSQSAAVTMEWGWSRVSKLPHRTDYAQNTAYISVLANVDGRANIRVNELVGYHFFHPLGYDFTITANTASEMTSLANSEVWGTLQITTTPYNHELAITDDYFSDSTEQNCKIHSNGERYDIVALPVVGGNTVEAGRYETSVMGGDPVIFQNVIEDYYLGESLKIKMRTWSNGTVSSWTEMEPGNFVKAAPFISPVSYGSPVLIAMPNISSEGAKVAANQITSGFTVQITGWDAASEYEIAYVAAPDTPSFTGGSSTVIRTTNRTERILTNDGKSYNITVRPLLSGYAVAPALSVSVVSGSAEPRGTIERVFPIQLQTYSGKYSSTGVTGWYDIWHTGHYTPATKVTAYSTDLSGIKKGHILTDVTTGVDLIVNEVNYSGITDTVKKIQVGLRTMTWDPYTATKATQDFLVNTSLRGRRVAQFSCAVDYVINSITLNEPLITYYSDTATLQYVTIRIYPEGSDPEAHWVRVIEMELMKNANGSQVGNLGELTFTVNKTISYAALSTRTIIIDMYDADGFVAAKTNYASIAGSLIMNYTTLST